MPNTLFSTYTHGENRVTGSILAVLERLSFDLVEQLLQALLQEPEAQLVTFDNQVRGPESVPDGRIRASFSCWIETKRRPRAITEEQIRAHLNALDAELNAQTQRLLILTPDETLPDSVSSVHDDRLVWASFADLVAAIEQALEPGEDWITSEHHLPTERERDLLRELARFLASERLLPSTLQEVLVVPARLALPEYLEHGVYMCEPNRAFRPASHLAFYAGGRIDRRVPAIVGSVDRVVLTVEGVAPLRNLRHTIRARLLELVQHLEEGNWLRHGWEQKVILLSRPDAPGTLNLDHDVENDLTSDAGRPVAFVQRQRYVPLSALQAGPSTTTQLLALAGRPQGRSARGGRRRNPGGAAA